MEQTGLMHKLLDTKFFFTSAVKLYQVAEETSPDRKQYAKMLEQVTAQIAQALKEKDILALLVLEKDALEYNYHKTSNEKNKDICRNALLTLQSIEHEWLQSQDKETIISNITSAWSGIDKPTKAIDNKSMSNHISSLSRQIQNIAGRDLTPAEDLFYNTRREALKVIKQVHYKLINQHLGLIEI